MERWAVIDSKGKVVFRNIAVLDSLPCFIQGKVARFTLPAFNKI